MKLPSKRQQFIWTNDNPLAKNPGSTGAHEHVGHLRFPLCECGRQDIGRNLTDSVVILRSKPRDSDIQAVGQASLPSAKESAQAEVLNKPRILTRPYPAELMGMWPISTRVNKPENDEKSILEPLELAANA